MATEVIMPQMGESVVEGTVGKWLKREGEAVEIYEPLLEVESDKVTSEVTAPASGTLLKIYVGEGRTVPARTVLALIGAPDEAIPDAPPDVPAPHGAETDPAVEVAERVPVAEPAREAAPASVGRSAQNGEMPHVTPVVARIAAEHQIDVRQVPGTGRGGRVTKKDVLAYLERRAAQPAA